MVSKVIFRRHLERLPHPPLGKELLGDLAEQAWKDDPQFALDDWPAELERTKTSLSSQHFDVPGRLA